MQYSFIMMITIILFSCIYFLFVNISLYKYLCKQVYKIYFYFLGVQDRVWSSAGTQ